MESPKYFLLCITVALAYYIWGVCNALLAPFFPMEAKSKGALISHSGFVFGVYSLAAFIFSPIFGKYGVKISPKYIYITGGLTQAVCTLAFGALHYIDNVRLFLGLSYLIRILSGMANAASFGSLLAALMSLFPNSVSKINAATELFCGIGYMVGPALGGWLYVSGGFTLPFLISGMVALVVAIMLIFAIPHVKPSEPERHDGTKLGFSDLLKIPSVLLALVGTFVSDFGFGMVEAMIALHFKTIGVETSVISAAFFISGGCYLISTTIAGIVTDKTQHPTIVSICGNVFLVIALTLIGPLPFIEYATKESMITSSFALMGFGQGLVCVSSLTRAQVFATRNGFPGSLQTYNLLSGLWLSFNFLGSFLGPSVGGVLVSLWGFRYTTALYWILQLIVLIADSIELTYYVLASNSVVDTGYMPIKAIKT